LNINFPFTKKQIFFKNNILYKKITQPLQMTPAVVESSRKKWSLIPAIGIMRQFLAFLLKQPQQSGFRQIQILGPSTRNIFPGALIMFLEKLCVTHKTWQYNKADLLEELNTQKKIEQKTTELNVFVHESAMTNCRRKKNYRIW